MKYIKVISFAIAVLLLTGCGSSKQNVQVQSQEKITSKFQFSELNFNFGEYVRAKNVVYHTQDELKQMHEDRLKSLMNEDRLISSDPTMNRLVISIDYQRRFMGDETPFPSDSLSPPQVNYKIEVFNENNKKLREFERRGLTYKGGFAFNLKVMAGGLRDKKYERDFMIGITNTIYESIKSL